MRLDSYAIIARAVYEGIESGWRRAHKHDDAPTDQAIRDAIDDAVMLDLSEVIRWDDDDPGEELRIGQHWLETAHERVRAGEPIVSVMLDYRWAPVGQSTVETVQAFRMQLNQLTEAVRDLRLVQERGAPDELAQAWRRVNELLEWEDKP